MATSEGMDKKKMMKKVKSQGGLMGYFGVTDTRIVQQKMLDGDEKAKLIYDSHDLKCSPEYCEAGSIRRR